VNRTPAVAAELDRARRCLDPGRASKSKDEFLTEVEATTLLGVSFLTALSKERVGMTEILESLGVVVLDVDVDVAARRRGCTMIFTSRVASSQAFETSSFSMNDFGRPSISLARPPRSISSQDLVITEPRIGQFQQNRNRTPTDSRHAVAILYRRSP
jgi:hypothetical protein